MKRFLTCAALVGALALGAAAAWAQEKAPADAHKDKVAPIALSDAASKAVAAAFPKATVGKVSLAGRGDNKVFSAALSEGDQKFFVQVTDGGVITRVSTPLEDPGTLPKAVKDAVNKTSDGATITSASKVELRADAKTFTPLDKAVVLYEIRFTVKGGTPNHTMAVAEDGTVLQAPNAPRGPKPPLDNAAPKS